MNYNSFNKGSYTFLTFYFLLFTFYLSSQSITGTLTMLGSQEIKLEGFNGLKTYPISSATIDSSGKFKLSYAKADHGVGYLMSKDNKPLFVILSGEDIEISGQALSEVSTLKTIKGQENTWFEQYAKEHPRREQALSAWDYLEKIYSFDSLFAVQKPSLEAILSEKRRIKAEDVGFLSGLPKASYVKWFLPTRKLVSSVSTVAQYRPEEMQETIAAFRSMDYTDVRLYKSGLFKDAIESHFWLLENSGRPLDSIFVEMKVSIDAMMVHLVKNEKKLNEVTDYLFDLLERQSLFQASEYLALKVLNEVSCTIDSDLAKQLETYRVMKKGNTAPDIVFQNNSLLTNPSQSVRPKKLSDVKAKNTLIVFGASWCPKCKEELPAIANFYSKWKSKDLEVVFISLDETKESHESFTKDFPFITTCDLKKWNGENVKNYYVFATPTMFLLDSNRTIVLRPNSVAQMDAWVDWENR